MIGRVLGILQQYGEDIRLCRKTEEQTVRAFLQPVTSKSWQNMDHVYQGLGQVPRGQYLYIGPPEATLEQGDQLCQAGREYIVRRADTIMLGGAPLYIWGLCVPKGGELLCGS